MFRSIAIMAACAAVSVAMPAAAATYVGSGAAIPDNSFTLSTITISDVFEIADLNVRIDNLAHNFAGDVQFTLTNGAISVLLFKNHGHNNYLRGALTFDDEAAQSITGYAQNQAATYRPFAALSAFDGLGAAGIWTLKAADTSGGISGSYGGWALEFTEKPTGAAVPEPATWAMMIMGFGAAGSLLRRRRAVAFA
ncbi:MAG: PEPxxWA-CTERM sorting domain-containing protein [Pseudomonadota bacterium]